MDYKFEVCESSKRPLREVNKEQETNKEEIGINSVKSKEDTQQEGVSKCEGVQGGDNSFETFWKAYPRKQGKGSCVKIWSRMKAPADTLQKILAALVWQRTSDQWTKDGGQFIPMPATYLNQARWLDDAVIAQPTKAEEYEMIRERIRLKKERGEL
jgi:hypothetical protein